jgi:hypothetical protein
VLPSNDIRDKHTDTGWREGVMKYAVEMGSVAMIYIQRFIKIGSIIRKLLRGIHRHSQHGDLVRLLLLFQNKEIRLKIIFWKNEGAEK